MLRILFALVAIATAFTAPPAMAQKRVALSFDDIPRQAGAFMTPEERTERILAALSAAEIEQVAFFVNPGHLEAPEKAGAERLIAAYTAAGHVIANHSYSHGHLSKTSAENYLADIDLAQEWLVGREGYRPWFRFPYLDEGAGDLEKRDTVRAGLATRGLSNGYVTADGSDWHLEALTVQAQRSGKAMNEKHLRRLYVASQMSGLEYHDQLARDTLGRSPAHVMLLHETDLAALFLPDLIAEMRKQGWTIITTDEAYADPIAQEQPNVPYAWGTLIGSMAWQRDVPPPLHPQWMSTGMITHLFETRVIEQK
uniref:polysaccharide deacetylase family protein n=1 Tax=Parerythrobacter lutipelagi TaxID=1964208 RepID=UPI0010F5ABB8|nr:polysaccharide deacetylase family protein [Parerythrobacter lutipelagi]